MPQAYYGQNDPVSARSVPFCSRFVPDLHYLNGMSKVRVDILDRVLKAISKKTGLMPSMKNLNAISEQIPGVSDNYLYKKIHSQISKKKTSEFIGLRTDQLNCVAQFLGYEDFRSLSSALERKDDPQLFSLVGNYYSYVRRNAEKLTVLRSPVTIWKANDGIFWFELKGPSQAFTGEIKKRHGCLFILIESKGGKAFFHVYKIGERASPAVLQGTFSGVSTAFDPIGGRAVLIRAEQPYTSLVNASLDGNTLKKSRIAGEKQLKAYFEEYLNNNVSPNRASAFDIADLE